MRRVQHCAAKCVASCRLWGNGPGLKRGGEGWRCRAYYCLYVYNCGGQYIGPIYVLWHLDVYQVLEVCLPESYPEGGTIIPANYATWLFGICRVPALVQKDSPRYSVPCSCHPTLLGRCCCDSTRTWTVPTHSLICCTVQTTRRSTWRVPLW